MPLRGPSGEAQNSGFTNAFTLGSTDSALQPLHANQWELRIRCRLLLDECITTVNYTRAFRPVFASFPPAQLNHPVLRSITSGISLTLKCVFHPRDHYQCLFSGLLPFASEIALIPTGTRSSIIVTGTRRAALHNLSTRETKSGGREASLFHSEDIYCRRMDKRSSFGIDREMPQPDQYLQNFK
ncbi:hypothetical protein SISSUDRAFT_886410 [Sistotremastrum suecicum HHB10207 ss-3]|uniref:Uncharacterized protein n=1 Tax=Sistotremastrum suecicum HHB10207 ss-3 TaxID=1314776 RepID=A0A166C782_9AGAM|nr:hypothetical protein SISSUDRAFT_886410 [Sistotremastrum suecicum HHB10207 ss-3]